MDSCTPPSSPLHSARIHCWDLSFPVCVMGELIPRVHFCPEILCPYSEGVMSAGLTSTGTGTEGESFEWVVSPA